MSTELPADACCRKCGYLLRGLRTPICPECGQAFDPADAKSYELNTLAARRRKWILRFAIAVTVAAVVIAVAPQGVLHSRMLVGCTRCGTAFMAHRWELRTPPWLASLVRYPGYSTSPFSVPAPATWPASSTQPSSCAHDWNYIGFSGVGGKGMASCTCRDGFVAAASGTIVTPDNLTSALNRLANPRGRPWTLHCLPDPNAKP